MATSEAISAQVVSFQYSALFIMRESLELGKREFFSVLQTTQLLEVALVFVAKDVTLLERFFLVGHEVSEACARRLMKLSNSS